MDRYTQAKVANICIVNALRIDEEHRFMIIKKLTQNLSDDNRFELLCLLVEKDTILSISDLIKKAQTPKGNLVVDYLMNEYEKDRSNQSIYEVAVLSAYPRDFYLWVEENRKENERYHRVSKMDDLAGWEFHRVEKSHRWTEMPNYLEVERVCLQRVRNIE